MKTWEDSFAIIPKQMRRILLGNATVDGATVAVNLVCEGAEDRLRLWLTFLVVAALRGVLYDVTFITIRVSRRDMKWWWSRDTSDLSGQTSSVHSYQLLPISRMSSPER